MGLIIDIEQFINLFLVGLKQFVAVLVLLPGSPVRICLVRFIPVLLSRDLYREFLSLGPQKGRVSGR
jgi:hypothetical protein